MLLAAASLVLGGCTAFERGAEQGDPILHAVTGCPDLTGTYALQWVDHDGNPDPSLDPDQRAAVDGGLFSPKTGRPAGVGPLSQYGSVTVRHLGTHGMVFDFAYPHGTVMASLETLRENERPRYAEWYALMQPEGRAAFVAQHGEAARTARLVELGPETGRSVTLERNRDYTCSDGWVAFPREYRQPVRMTLDPKGHLVFESKEFTTFDVPVWCGDGCKGFKIPTGAYLGTERWHRDPSATPWDADQVAQNFVFARPAGVVEAEQAQFVDHNRRNAERRFATPEQVRDALTPLLPEGVAVREVEISSLPFKGARVRVHAVPADPSMPSEEQRVTQQWFLAALKEGDPGFIEDSEVVQRVISNGGNHRYEMEVFLDTHPAVQPRREPAPVAVADEKPVLVSFTPAPEAPDTRAATATTVPTSDPVPTGFAALHVVESRLAALADEGCRTTRLRYAGTALIIDGESADMPCVSRFMRSIDAARADGDGHVELVQIAAEASGRYRFQIRLPESALTKA